MNSRGKNVIKSFSLIALITILSKLFGFFRDAALSYAYGASSVTDAFNVVQFLPNFLYMVIQQAVSVGFIPVFLSIRKKSEEESNGFAVTAILVLSFVSGLLCLALFFFPSFWISLFATGFAGETASLAINMLRMTAWSLLLQSIILVLASYLNALRRFIAPACLGFVLDLSFILAMALSKGLNRPELLGLGPLISAVAQAILLIAVSKKRGFRFAANFRQNMPNLRKMLIIALPSVVSLGLSQLNYFVDKNVSSNYPPGSISALSLSANIVNAVETVVVASLATVLYTEFSKLQSEDKNEETLNLLFSTGKKLTAFLIPASLFLFIAADPIVKLLYGHGSFSQGSVVLTANCCRYYALCLPFLGLSLIIARYFYALKKAKYVVVSSCLALMTNIFGDLIVWKLTSFGVEGLAIVTSLSNVVNFASLMICLAYHSKKGANSMDWCSAVVQYGASFVAAAIVFLPVQLLGMTWSGFAALLVSGPLYVLAFVSLYLLYCKYNDQATFTRLCALKQAPKKLKKLFRRK